MQFKTNVTVTFTKTNKAILGAVEDACYKIFGANDKYEPVCTSGLEGTHAEESGHYHGRALDFRLMGTVAEQKILQDEIEKQLTYYAGRYLVLTEDDHIHIQRQKDSF